MKAAIDEIKNSIDPAFEGVVKNKVVDSITDYVDINPDWSDAQAEHAPEILKLYAESEHWAELVQANPEVEASLNKAFENLGIARLDQQSVSPIDQDPGPDAEVSDTLLDAAGHAEAPKAAPVVAEAGASPVQGNESAPGAAAIADSAMTATASTLNAAQPAEAGSSKVAPERVAELDAAAASAVVDSQTIAKKEAQSLAELRAQQQHQAGPDLGLIGGAIAAIVNASIASKERKAIAQERATASKLQEAEMKALATLQKEHGGPSKQPEPAPPSAPTVAKSSEPTDIATAGAVSKVDAVAGEKPVLGRSFEDQLRARDAAVDSLVEAAKSIASLPADASKEQKEAGVAAMAGAQAAALKEQNALLKAGADGLKKGDISKSDFQQLHDGMAEKLESALDGAADSPVAKGDPQLKKGLDEMKEDLMKKMKEMIDTIMRALKSLFRVSSPKPNGP